MTIDLLLPEAPAPELVPGVLKIPGETPLASTTAEVPATWLVAWVMGVAELAAGEGAAARMAIFGMAVPEPANGCAGVIEDTSA